MDKIKLLLISIVGMIPVFVITLVLLLSGYDFIAKIIVSGYMIYCPLVAIWCVKTEKNIVVR